MRFSIIILLLVVLSCKVYEKEIEELLDTILCIRSILKFKQPPHGLELNAIIRGLNYLEGNGKIDIDYIKKYCEEYKIFNNKNYSIKIDDDLFKSLERYSGIRQVVLNNEDYYDKYSDELMKFYLKKLVRLTNNIEFEYLVDYYKTYDGIGFNEEEILECIKSMIKETSRYKLIDTVRVGKGLILTNTDNYTKYIMNERTEEVTIVKPEETIENTSEKITTYKIYKESCY